MSKRRKKHPLGTVAQRVPLNPSAPDSKPERRALLIVSALGCLIGAVATFASLRIAAADGREIVSSRPLTAASSSQYPTLAELCAMSPEQLAGVDVAVLNLLCAKGLPGAERLDIAASLDTLDQWAAKVREVTQRHLYRAHDPRYVEHYRHSEAILKAEMLCQVLQEDLGVRYNLERVENIDFTDSRDLFIHGLTSDGNSGTCVSMPALYAAVGLRLGYPVKLVEAKAHLFCRWEDDKERFNFDGAGSGFATNDDDFYRQWPRPISEQEVMQGQYL